MKKIKYGDLTPEIKEMMYEYYNNVKCSCYDTYNWIDDNNPKAYVRMSNSYSQFEVYEDRLNDCKDAIESGYKSLIAYYDAVNTYNLQCFEDIDYPEPPEPAMENGMSILDKATGNWDYENDCSKIARPRIVEDDALPF